MLGGIGDLTHAIGIGCLAIRIDQSAGESLRLRWGASRRFRLPPSDATRNQRGARQKNQGEHSRQSHLAELLPSPPTQGPCHSWYPAILPIFFMLLDPQNSGKYCLPVQFMNIVSSSNFYPKAQ